jgi:hypothetical protein
MREDITDECCDRADRRLSSRAIDCPVHLCEKGNRDGPADNPANRGEECVLETERGKNVSACHYEKAGEPRPRELFSSGASKPPARKSPNASRRLNFKLRIDRPSPLRRLSHTAFLVVHRLFSCAVRRRERVMNSCHMGSILVDRWKMLANDARTLAKVWRVSGPRLHCRSGTRLKTRTLMARLPQQYDPLVYGIIQAAITTAVATAIATLQLTDFNMRFVIAHVKSKD